MGQLGWGWVLAGDWVLGLGRHPPRLVWCPFGWAQGALPKHKEMSNTRRVRRKPLALVSLLKCNNRCTPPWPKNVSMS